MKRRKTKSSNYEVDEYGRIKKKEITISPTTETMIALSMLTESFGDLSSIDEEQTEEDGGE